MTAGCLGYGVRRCPNKPRSMTNGRYRALNYCAACAGRKRVDCTAN